jgi:hypothetical protein
MGKVDAAIHAKHRTFNWLLDGRVKPGHDNGRSRYFIHSLEQPESVAGHVPRFLRGVSHGPHMRVTCRDFCRPALVFADIFVPNLGMFANKPLH